MVILRIRQAETAMADGRLDEAFEQAIREDVRSHRRGQKLTERLAGRLLERGQAHLNAERYVEALSDCERAGRLTGNQDRVADLRIAAQAALKDRDDDRRQKQQLVAMARQQIDKGEFSIGERVLGQLPDDQGAGMIAQHVAVKRDEVDVALERAAHAIESKSTDAAIAELLKVQKAQSRNPQLVELKAQLSEQMLAEIEKAIQAGRLDQAATQIDHLQPLAAGNQRLLDAARIVEECQQASAAAERGDLRFALQSLRRVKQLTSATRWVDQAIKEATLAAESIDNMQSGPLGLLQQTALHETRAVVPKSRHVTIPDAVARSSELPMRFLLQVDGAGSYLVVRNQNVSIGSVKSSRRPDIGLLTDSGSPNASIVRLDDDYFLRSERPVRVNDKDVKDKLLTNGDSITIGSRSRMRFRLPNAASTTAVLELTGAKLPRPDIRNVILLDESIVIANNRSAHVTVRDADANVVLHLRNGQLCFRNGGTSTAVVEGVPVETGGVSFVVSDWEGESALV